MPQSHIGRSLSIVGTAPGCLEPNTVYLRPRNLLGLGRLWTVYAADMWPDVEDLKPVSHAPRSSSSDRSPPRHQERRLSPERSLSPTRDVDMDDHSSSHGSSSAPETLILTPKSDPVKVVIKLSVPALHHYLDGAQYDYETAQAAVIREARFYSDASTRSLQGKVVPRCFGTYQSRIRIRVSELHGVEILPEDAPPIDGDVLQDLYAMVLERLGDGLDRNVQGALSVAQR